MIKSLIAALALSTLCIPQVEASTYTEQDLLNTFKDMGGRYYIDSEICDRYKGIFGAHQRGVIHLCTQPHGRDVAEWNDTIRHEVWHVVQMCNEGPITKNAVSMIDTARRNGWKPENYPPSAWHKEAEAHYVAATRSAEEIRNGLIKACS
ncbi:hypothetical protein STIP28_14 [Synechococcus T7-like virus S-TIP28]|uniref:Uncharacterized protein n=1 Tax=Synechococcus T7-like virus S-TIP28 TaxID=1332140 RepID=A0AAE8XF82_9CAUD|nr:hypothetical protein STIP28_14 [Synechococcus T7-like virus S-TIP28]